MIVFGSRTLLVLALLILAGCNTGRPLSANQYIRDGYSPLINGNDLPDWEYKPGHQGHWVARNGVIYYDGNSEEKDKSLWTKKKYKDFILVADVRFPEKPVMAKSPVVLPNGDYALNSDGTEKKVDMPYAGDTGLYLRGNSKSQVNIGNRYIGSGEIYGYRVDRSLPESIRAGVTPKVKADKPLGQWNRFVVTMKGDRVSVSLNGILVVDNAQLPGVPSEGPIALQDDHASGNVFQFANVLIKEL